MRHSGSPLLVRRDGGFTVVELMVAMAISLLLLAGVASVSARL